MATKDTKDSKEVPSLNPRAIYSKTGKGVQEASGKTSHLSRADRAVLAAIDGKSPLSEVQKNFDKLAGPKFDALIQQLDKDGFIREVSSGVSSAPSPRPAAAAAKPAPKAAPSPSDDGSVGLDFTQLTSALPKQPSAPKPPPVDLAAAARAEAERKAKEQQALDFRTRQEAEAKAKAEAEARARAAAAEARARAEAEATARAEAEAKARAEAAARAQAEAEAKVRAAREAAVRLAAEAKAKAEAEVKAKSEAAEKEKARLEAELNAKLEAERKAREEAERRAAEAAEQARKDLEEKARRDAEEMRRRLEAEMQAKLEAERKAREEEDRKRREEEDRRRKEEEERRAKEEAERKAREEAERKRREEEDRRRREEEARRRKEDEERRAKEEADRKRREEEDRKHREEDERRRKEDEERRAREEAERKARAEVEAKARAAADAAASLPKIEAVAPPPPPPAASSGGFGDSLLADLDSFGKRDEEEQKAREAAERKAKEDAERKAKEEAERRAREEAERKRREEETRRRKEDEERRAKEEAERKAHEEEARHKEEEEERKRKAKAEQAAKQAAERAEKAAAAKSAARKAPAAEDDIPVTEEDLDTDDLKRDQKVAAEKARRAAREAPAVAVAAARPRKLGKPIAIALAALLVVGLGVLNFMPVSTAEYEKAASAALGLPVKIGSARLSVLTGVELRLENVTVGSAVKVRSVRGSPEIGSLFGARKAFSRIELEGAQIAESQLGDALLGKVSGENFRVARVVIKQAALDGPLKLPPLDVDAALAGDGTVQSVRLTGGDKIVATLSPKGSDIGFEVSAGSLALPFVPALSLSEFSMKGSANRSGVVSSEFDGRVFDGVLSGSARVRWGDTWNVEGELKARNLKVAVFAPTLVSDGRVDGRAAYSMSGGAPESLYERARVQGEFKIDKGVLGSVDIARALQTGGAQSSGQTSFNEMSGQGVYDKGAMQFSNVVLTAGALNAGIGLNIDANGGLAGRIVADVKTASQKQSATLNISGKVQDPVLRK